MEMEEDYDNLSQEDKNLYDYMLLHYTLKSNAKTLTEYENFKMMNRINQRIERISKEQDISEEEAFNNFKKYSINPGLNDYLASVKFKKRFNVETII